MKRSRKRMFKAAGKAPAWVRDVAAAKSGGKKQIARHKSRGFFNGHAPAPVKKIPIEEYFAAPPAQTEAAA